MTKQTEPIKMPERENANEDYLKRRCATLGWECWKLKAESRKGVPDRLVMAGYEVYAFIELKKKQGGIVSPLQARTLEKLNDLEMKAYILDNKQDIDHLLAGMKQKVESRKMAKK